MTIVHFRLISLLLAQVSENKELNDVLADIFDAEGSEIYLKPARDYIVTDMPVDFYTAVEDWVKCITACHDGGYSAIVERDGHKVVDPALCVGCSLCAQVCPTGAIRMVAV